MNKTILSVFLAVFLAGIALAYAAADVKGDDAAKPLANNASNMTVGQCVAAAALVKNTCFSTVKDARTACRTDAKNQTDPKAASKACSSTWKKDLKQCKVDFKQDKKDCSALKKPKRK